MPYITEKLHQDHQKVEEIFRKLMETGDGAEKTRLDLCQKLKHELLAHAEFEESVFYPAVRDRNGVGQQVKEGIEEHNQVKGMLSEIEEMEPTAPEFMEKIEEIQQAVQHHVDEEESEIFPAAKKLIDKDEGEEMSTRHDEMVQEHMRAAR
jgi:hemerythrin superfamily protein